MNTIDHTTGALGENKKQRILLKLDDKQKQALTTGGIGLGGVLVGASIMPLYSFTDEANESTPVATEEANTSIETELPVATVEEGLSFSDAFAAARKDVGAGGFFEWNGNTYNTYYKEEWEALSEEEQADYLSSVEEATDVETMTEYTATTEPVETAEESAEMTEPVEMTEEAPSQEQVAMAEEAPILEPEFGVEDIDENGQVDAVVVDLDNDGFADGYFMDVNEDGHADGIAFDEDGDGDLDVLVIDTGQDGYETNFEVQEIDGYVSMDDFVILDEEDLDQEEDIAPNSNTEIAGADIEADDVDGLDEFDGIEY